MTKRRGLFTLQIFNKVFQCAYVISTQPQNGITFATDKSSDLSSVVVVVYHQSFVVVETLPAAAGAETLRVLSELLDVLQGGSVFGRRPLVVYEVRVFVIAFHLPLNKTGFTLTRTT